MELKENIIGLRYVGITSDSPGESAGWYIENLGFSLIEKKDVHVPVKSELAVIALGNLKILLFQPASGNAASRRDGIIDHLAIGVKDFESEVLKAYTKGMKLHPSTGGGMTFYEHLGKAGVWGANFIGPSQEVVELCKDMAETQKAKTGLTGLAHIALKIRNLKESGKFYESLGFAQAGSGYLDTTDGRLEIGFFRLKDVLLELIQMTGDSLAELKTRGAGRIDHFALGVEEAGKALQCIRKMGYHVEEYGVKEAPLLGKADRFFTVSGPDGEKIIFHQESA